MAFDDYDMAVKIGDAMNDAAIGGAEYNFAWDVMVNSGEWSPGTAYSANDVVKPTAPDGLVYVALNDGTSGGAEPAWPTEPYSGPPPVPTTVADNTVTWQTLYTNFVFIRQLSAGFMAMAQSPLPLSPWAPFTSPTTADGLIPHTHTTFTFVPATMLLELESFMVIATNAAPWITAVATRLSEAFRNLNIVLNTGESGEPHDIGSIPDVFDPAEDSLLSPAQPAVYAKLSEAAADAGIISPDLDIWNLKFSVGLCRYFAQEGEVSDTIPDPSLDVPHIHEFL